MNSALDISFTSDHALSADGSVTFQCSTDQEQWPWITLHPHNPIATQNLQYWASVETGSFRGTFDRLKWSALVWTKWTNGAANVGPWARGVAEYLGDEAKPEPQLTLLDAKGAEICRMQSKGVIFQNRDFEAWREHAKQASSPVEDIGTFDFASAETVGSSSIGPSLLSDLRDDGVKHALGLIAVENAMPPAHPFMSGSGDHVNATHLAEAAHQFVHLLEGGTPLRLTGGEMRFTSYVELGRPFRIELAEQSENSASMIARQAGKDCTIITLGFERR